MPEQRQLLGQRVGAEVHPVHPPRLQPAGGARRVGQGVGGLLEVLRHAVAPRLAGQDAGDALVRAVGQVAIDLAAGGAEARPTVQVNDAAAVPGHFLRGRVRFPVLRGLAAHRRHSFPLIFTSPISTTLPPGLTYTPSAMPTSATYRSIRMPGITPSMRKFPLSSVSASRGGLGSVWLRQNSPGTSRLTKMPLLPNTLTFAPATGRPFASSRRPVTAGSGAIRTVTGPLSSALTWATAASFFSEW